MAGVSFGAAALPILSIRSFQFDGLFIGATWTGAMRDTMLVTLAVFMITPWFALSAFGNYGLWLALAAYNVTRAAAMAALYPAFARTV